MKIDFLLIAQKIVLKILLIKKCAYNSSTLFYPVPFNPFVMQCYPIPNRTFHKKPTDVYSHIIDEDRRLNAQRFEETFYQKKNPSEVNGATVEPKKEPQGITEEAMLNYMVQNPDFLQKFKVLLGVGN